MGLAFLDGYKSYIGAALGILTGLLQGLGFIDDTLANTGYTVATAIFGAGMAGKAQKIADALKDSLAKVLLAAILAGGLLVAGAPVQADSCDFSEGVDAKVVRFAWPPSVGVNALGFIDLEVGILGFTSACGVAKANLVGGLCLIPKVGPLLAGLCSGGNTGG
jgi:hypothetical protein